MRFIFLFSLVCMMISCDTNSNSVKKTETELGVDIGFDSLLAKEIGADDYGMKQYVMAFLKDGPNRPQDKSTKDSIQRMHMANIGKLAEEGKLILAGPFLEEEYEVRGIYIFNTNSLEEAKAWTSTDPAVQYGSLVMDLHPWYGSAGLMKVNEFHDRISKIKF